MPRLRRLVPHALVALAAALAACAGPTPPPEGASPTAAVAVTVIAAASTTPTLTATTPRVLTPTAPPTATETPTPTSTPPCVDNLVYLKDVTVPDGSQFLPGQPIDKQWSVRNAGNCDWGADYRLVLVSGNALGPRSEVALYPARAGAEAVLQVPMLAPADPGQYTGRWQARNPDGKLFGNVVFIKVEVIALPATDTPTP